MRPLEKKQPKTSNFVSYWHYRQGWYLPTPAATHFTQPVICTLQNHFIYPLPSEEVPPVSFQAGIFLSNRKKPLIFLFAKADILQYFQKCSECTGWEEKAQDNIIGMRENSQLMLTHPHSTKLLQVDHPPPRGRHDATYLHLSPVSLYSLWH